MSDFRTRTVNALGWSFGSKFTSQLISVIFGIVLARLLVPEDFGLVAMLMVVVGFATLLADVGLGAALIQKQGATEQHFSSVFWLNNLIGLFLSIFLFLISPYVAAFYQQPDLEKMSMALSVIFVISTMSMVPKARLSKALAFRELALVDLSGMILSGVVAIAMANAGYGYWSLVAQKIVERITTTLMVWLVGRWKPQFRFSVTALRELIGFSSSVFLTGSLRYTTSQVDKLLIGKFLGASSLGLYEKAYTMMLFPLQNISQVIGSVMFPALSQVQDDKMRVRDIYQRVTRAISLITFPMMAGMFVVVDSFVLSILGEQWTGIIPIFKIFCVVGFFVSIATVTGAVYQSLGHAKLQLKVNLISQPIQIAGIAVGLYWGLDGVIIGFSVTAILGVFITWYFAGKLIDLSILNILNNVYPAFVLSVIMGVIVWLSGLKLIVYGVFLSFMFQAIIGLIAYVSLVMIFKPRAYHDVRMVLVKQYSKK